MLRYKRIQREIFIVRNWITLLAAISDYSEAAVQSYPFSNISSEIAGCRVLVLVKLQTDCSEYRFFSRMFSWKSSESFRSAQISYVLNIWGKFILSSIGDILSMLNICLLEANISWNHIFLVSSQLVLSNRWQLILWQWVSFITYTIFKEKYESKRSIKFEPIHVSRNKKWSRYYHYSRSLFEKSENIKIKNIIFLVLAFFQKVKSVWLAKLPVIFEVFRASVANSFMQKALFLYL